MAKKIKKSKNITQEAQFIREKRLDYNLVKVFTGEWRGTKAERQALEQLKKILKEDIYIEIIYILSHKIISDFKKAKGIYYKILDHKEHLMKKLKRNVGIEVATLDFMKNIQPFLNKPEIIEKDKLIKLAKKAITDEATGVYDREAMSANLDAEIERAKRYRRPLSLLFCDIDDFKTINDKYGHKLGDAVLQMTAEILRNTVRNTDRVYRYGGEEFVCILSETDIKSATVAAQRIRKKIADMDFSGSKNKSKLQLTISIGVSQYGISNINNADKLVSSADAMMYEAKNAGKNCVRIYRAGRK